MTSSEPARRRPWAAGLAVLAIGATAAWWWNRTPAPTGVADAPGAASAPAAGASAGHRFALNDEQLQRMVTQARAQTASEPANATAWALLAHSLEMQGQAQEAVAAYAALVKLRPEDANVLADYAGALAALQGRRFAGEPAALIARALQRAPQHPKALMLDGVAAFEAGDAPRALAQLQRALATQPEPALRAAIDAEIVRVRAEPAPAASAATAVTPAAPGASAVSGRVSVAAALKDKIPAGATVFIFARPAEGSRMPVAILKRPASELPFDFKLDDAQAMVPDRRISSTPALRIGARISASGDVRVQAGDLQGWSAVVAPGASGIALDIAEVLK